MPGKAAAAAIAVQRSDRVAALGVANTLVRLPDGRWRAENTDVDGVLGALNGVGLGSGDGRALLLGGGGTALAVLAALAERGWTGPVLVAGRQPAEHLDGIGPGGPAGAGCCSPRPDP